MTTDDTPVTPAELPPGWYASRPAELLATKAHPSALLSSPGRLRSHFSPRPETTRAEGEDFRQWPSRVGNTLVYRDGRREEIRP